MLDKLRDVPYVDMVATRSADGKSISLLCVNRSLDLDCKLASNWDRSMTGDAEVKQIRAASR